MRALLVSGHVQPAPLLEWLADATAEPWEGRRILLWVIGVRPPRRHARYKKAVRAIEASFCGASIGYA